VIDFPDWGAGTGAFRLADEVARLHAVVAVQNEVSTAVADAPTLMALVATRAQEMTGAAGAVVETAAGESLVCAAATGSARSQLGRHVPIAGSLPGLAFLTADVVTSDDTKNDLRIDHAAAVDRTNARSVVAIPLLSANKPFGVLQVLSPRPNGFGDEHVEMLRLLAGIVSARLDLAAQLHARQVLLAENAVTLEALRESESRFRNAFDNSGIGMALVAPDGRWLKVNATLCRIVGYSTQELLARDFQSITHHEDLGTDLGFVQRMLSGEITSYEVEKRYLHKSGATVWIMLTASLVKNPEGVPLYFVSQIQDISARKAAEEALLRLAVRDELTGLFNRREMNRLLQEEILRSQRHNRPLSLLMVDIDLFKRVNDTYGHQTGDRALQQVAKAVLDSVRTLDRAARYGGEELAIILPETSETEALVVAERIRNRVADTIVHAGQEAGGGPAIKLTVSIGVSMMSLPLDGSTERLIGEADRALYVAKRRGRNCSVLSSDVEDARPAAVAASSTAA
jgi:diguanylate cyclase (GGDEF)-like protein/PAS domain S-box-containing protein